MGSDLLVRVVTWIRETVSSGRERLSTHGRRAGSNGIDLATSSRAKKFAAAVAAIAVTVAIFWYTMQSRGVVAALLYTVLFGFCATLFPIGISLFGGATPNSVGKLHLLLGAVAFDHHYIVQREHAWEWCPGDRGRVWIDEEWHEIKGDSFENYSVLGWRPFGILRYKDDATWAEKRVDEAGLKARGAHDRERDPTTDGGTTTVERGSFEAVERPIISGQEGTWLLDLKRIFTTGVRKIGDIELVETAEEVIERKQVSSDGKMGSAGPVVETVGGLFLGILAGYGYLFLMG